MCAGSAGMTVCLISYYVVVEVECAGVVVTAVDHQSHKKNLECTSEAVEWGY